METSPSNKIFGPSMENLSTGIKAACAKAPISTVDTDSVLVEELQQERLRQSRIIARQLDTIGKLKRALDMVMIEKSSRRSSVTGGPVRIPDVNIPADIDLVDAGQLADSNPVRTRAEDVDYDQVRRALGYLAEENIRLSRERQDSEEALRAEREKAKRILTVCTRITSSPDSGISSPALAKWVSLGLEESIFPPRPRTETIDDSVVCRSLRFPEGPGGSSTTRSRSALSEGDSPVAGLDLDMIYGSSFEPHSHAHPDDAVPLTPKASNQSNRCNHAYALGGAYWTGSEVIFLQSVNEATLEGQNVSITMNSSFPFFQSQDGSSGQVIGSRLKWDSGEQWDPIPLADRMRGEWWTGFGIVTLEPDLTGILKGVWGVKQIEIRPSSPISALGIGNVICRLSDVEIEMVGTLSPKYEGATKSIVQWGNGQVWEQQSSH